MKVRIPNSGGGGNMNQMLKQAQKMQEDMAVLQGDLENREYSATAGGGMVSVTVDGKHLIKSIKINPEAVDTEDIEMLEDLVVAAVNEAIRMQADDEKERLGRIRGEMGRGLGGLF